MLKDTLMDVLNQIWPMILILIVIIASVRLAYLLSNHKRIILYKEIFMLIFLIYVLILFYIVTYQDTSSGTSNFSLFKEIFRYKVGSTLFYRITIGNILLFVPLGLFVTYYIKNDKLLPVLGITFISSLAIEYTQSKIGRVFDIDDILLNVVGGLCGYLLYRLLDSISDCLPDFLRTDLLKNIVVIVIIIISILYFLNFNTALLRHLL